MSQSVYTKASDIYAFGIVCFEIITEKEAFKGLEGFNLINAVVTNKKRPALRLECEYARELSALIEKCWDHIPGNRPSADHLCKMLLKILKKIKKSSKKSSG